MGKWGMYPLNLLVAIDQAVSTILGGDPRETLSRRLARGQVRGEPFACYVCHILHKTIRTNHCPRSLIEWPPNSREIFPL